MVFLSASFPTRELKEICLGCLWVALNYGLISYYASYFFSGSCLIHCRSIKMNRNETNNLSQFLWVGLSPLIMFRSSPFVSKWSLVCRTANGRHQMFLYESEVVTRFSFYFHRRLSSLPMPRTERVCDSRRSEVGCQMPYLHAMQTVAGAVRVSQRFGRLKLQLPLSFSSFV